MATRPKTPPKAPKGNGSEPSAAPEGFKVVELDMPLVSWKSTPSVSGLVLDGDIFQSKKGPKRVLILDLDGVPTRLIEQAGMRRLFDKACIGDSVWVATTGTKDLGGGHSLRTFEGAIREGKDRKPIPPLPVMMAPSRSFGAPDADGVIDEQ